MEAHSKTFEKSLHVIVIADEFAHQTFARVQKNQSLVQSDPDFKVVAAQRTNSHPAMLVRLAEEVFQLGQRLPDFLAL